MIIIQEQVNDKAVAISIKGVKLTGRVLAKAMQAFLKKAREPTYKHGKQSIKSLSKHGASLVDAKIDGDDIGAFKHIARKYNVDFAIKRDAAAEEPRCIVFFKAKDSKSIESAFNEYTKLLLKHKDRKPSMIAKLRKFKEIARATAAPTKNRDRGGHEL